MYVSVFLQRVRIARNADRCNDHSDSVRPSVTFRCFVQMNEDTIVRFSASGRKIILVSGEKSLSGYWQGITPIEGVKVKHPYCYNNQ